MTLRNNMFDSNRFFFNGIMSYNSLIQKFI